MSRRLVGLRFGLRCVRYVLLALLAACHLACKSEPRPAPRCDDGATPIVLSGPSCDPLRAPELGCRAPREVEGALAQPNASTVQRAADLFSWQQLIALSWPAASGRRGEPDVVAPIAAPGPRVWETWKEAYELYRPGDVRAWDEPMPVPAGCEGARVMSRAAKVSDVLDARVQALPADATLPATLKDQQGRLIRYEIRLNRTLFDHIVARRLHDGREQVKADAVSFPVGSQLVKAAWRELDEDDARWFVSADACLCDPTDASQHTCRRRRMGLVGWHLMTKTAAAPQWIWSTFEHVDNVMSRHRDVAPLNDPTCPPERCPPNRQTADAVPTQLARVVPIPATPPDCGAPARALDDVARLNADVQAALAASGSALAHYELVGTQWPLRARAGEAALAEPAVLGNTTMESFAQATSSCMGCHAMARTLAPDRFVSADFSFTLNDAEPRPPAARCRDVEASESCDLAVLGPPPVDAAKDVLRGYALATRTYELLGPAAGGGGDAPAVVGAKLHCASCHLDGGGNASAAWWVDMARAYPGPTALQARINQCFEHSLNGRALCTPGAACDADANMSALVAYMAWLDHAYRTRGATAPPARGFPDEASADARSPGDPARGEALYAQRCAFCHGADGAGRYGHDTYFRPALWGARSFAATAGMARAPTLAAFIRANMPYTSGGSLSWADARDLAAFIGARCRPPATCP